MGGKLRAPGCPTSTRSSASPVPHAAHEGPLNWDLRRHRAQDGGPGGPARPAPAGRVADAVRLADHWLDETTASPPASPLDRGLGRAEWIGHHRGVEGARRADAESSVNAVVRGTPGGSDVRAAAGHPGPAVGGMLAQQVGSGSAPRPRQSLSVSDIRLPWRPRAGRRSSRANVTVRRRPDARGRRAVLPWLREGSTSGWQFAHRPAAAATTSSARRRLSAARDRDQRRGHGSPRIEEQMRRRGPDEIPRAHGRSTLEGGTSLDPRSASA